MASTSSINGGCVGVLLAGGQSRRMGGGDKSLMPLAGQPMLAHAIAKLRPQVDALVLNANGNPARFASFGLAVAPDRDTDFAGPLAGLLAGLEWTRAHYSGATWGVTAACDTPFFPGDLVPRLHAAAETHKADIALAASGDQSHFVFALWRVALAGDLAAYLAEGRRKVQHWIERHPHVTVEFAPVDIGGAAVDPFFNVNTPEDLAEAEALLRGRSA